MDFSKTIRLNQAALSLLGEGTINEAYHEKDREAKKELADYLQHHYIMRNRHQDVARGTTKNKELSKHDLACLAHDFACAHFNGLQNSMSGLPQDYHQDRDFYDKLNKLVSSRADSKSKEAGVDTNTENK